MRFILETNDIAKNRSLPKMPSKNNFPMKIFEIIFNFLFFIVRVFRRLDCTNLPRSHLLLQKTKAVLKNLQQSSDKIYIFISSKKHSKNITYWKQEVDLHLLNIPFCLIHHILFSEGIEKGL